MPLVNYEGDSSEGEEEEQHVNAQSVKDNRRIHLPAPSHPVSKPIIKDIDDDDDDDDEYSTKSTTQASSNLLANLPKPQAVSSSNATTNPEEFTETELEDIVRGDNKVYAKNIPELPKPPSAPKRKRDGPVKIFIPTVDQDSDEEDKPKRKQPTIKRNCALLNTLPPPLHDEDKPTASTLPVVKNPSKTTPQITSSGLFIPYTLNKKSQQQTAKKTATTSLLGPSKNDSDDDDDDDVNDQSDFLGLTKTSQIEITHTDVESVLRETLPKARPVVVEQPILPQPTEDFEDLDEDDAQTTSHQTITDDDELIRYLPKSERYKEIKTVHIDSMFAESARLQLLKNATEERETMLAQAAIHVPKGEAKKRSQLTYLVAKAQHDDLQLKNMWSQQKLTKRQTQAKYGF
ncbi:unnamed protein product [Adineta ricciae]|uniref:Proline-rich protein PRCC n=1 Tax=Adineta ricciae TaxID=249248 RepID=A0A814U3D8_ADIRI|nr:unnamed protein product [Adineta ricciae]CAF1166600.1 unnamed protein product [Adineta ricciae]